MDFFVLKTMKKKVFISFAQNEHEKKVLEHYGFKKNEVIPLGIDFDFFQTKTTKNSARKKLNIDQHSYLFCYLGRFSPVKGIEVLLNAFKMLQKNVPNIKLLLVGRDDGFEKQILNFIKVNNLKDKILVSEPLYDKERILAYKASDCFISTPTVYEETSTTCLEALASNTNVITNKFAEIPLLENESFLQQLKSNNPRLVAQSMYAMILKKSHVDLKKIKKIFDWNSIINNIMSAYEKK